MAYLIYDTIDNKYIRSIYGQKATYTINKQLARTWTKQQQAKKWLATLPSGHEVRKSK